MNTDLLLALLRDRQQYAEEQASKECRRYDGFNSPDHIKASCKAEVLGELIDAITEAL